MLNRVVFILMVMSFSSSSFSSDRVNVVTGFLSETAYFYKKNDSDKFKNSGVLESEGIEFPREVLETDGRYIQVMINEEHYWLKEKQVKTDRDYSMPTCDETVTSGPKPSTAGSRLLTKLCR